MLDALRRNASGWVAKVLIGLLAISFAVWGIADIFTGAGSTTVAVVGEEKIDDLAFQRELRSEISQFSERLNQPLTLAQARNFGLDRVALSRLVGLSVVDSAASEMGLTVGDEAVGLDIMTDPNLQGPFGRFDRDLFRRALMQNGISEDAFIDQRRKYLARLQLVGAIQGGVHIPDSLVDAVALYQEESRIANYIILPASLAGEIPAPSENEIAEFYEAGASAFILPETRDFSVMELEIDDLARTIEIPDDVLAATYEQRRNEYDVPERRAIMQVTFPSQETAQAAADRIASGEATIRDIIRDQGLSVEDADLGKVSRDQLQSSALADAAFALGQNEVSAPVQGPLGWVLLHVSAIEAPKATSFEQVKDELYATLRMEQARDQLYDIQNSIEDSRAGGETLAEIANRYSLEIRNFTGVTSDGRNRAGDTVELPELPNLLRTVYENEMGEQIPPLDTGTEGYYWVEIDSVTPSERQPLEAVRDQVLTVWNNQKREEALEELAIRLAARGNAGESFDTIAGEFGRSVLASAPLSRYSSNDTFSRDAVTKLFAIGEGSFTYGRVGLGDSLVLMQVKEVRTPALNRESARYAELRDSIAGTYRDDALISFISGYQNRIKVEVNTGLIERLTSTDSSL